MTGLPLWLRKRMSEDGSLRTAKPSRCGKCRRNTLKGLDADRCAMSVEVDSQELDAVGEVLATLRNVQTFDLVLSGGTWELCYRMARHIRRPERRYPVVAAHSCEYVYPPAAATHPLLRQAEPKTALDTPPF